MSATVAFSVEVLLAVVCVGAFVVGGLCVDERHYGRAAMYFAVSVGAFFTGQAVTNWLS